MDRAEERDGFLQGKTPRLGIERSLQDEKLIVEIGADIGVLRFWKEVNIDGQFKTKDQLFLPLNPHLGETDYYQPRIRSLNWGSARNFP